MFDIGWDEMALVAVVALIVIGPKDLPVVLRQVGRWTRKARELAGEFQRGVDDMVRESELSDLKTQVEKATDPNLLRREVEKTVDPTGDIARSLEPPVMPPVDEQKLADEAPTPVEDAASFEAPRRPPEP
jgi:sec-independent protein translocase protein TatB